MIGDIFQPTHLIFIFVVALLVLGPKRLPEVGRSLGKGIRDFKGAMAGIEDHTKDAFDLGLGQSSAPPEFDKQADSVVAAPAEPAEVPAPAASTPAFAAPAATVSPAVATPGATASGSGLAEPDPGDYAD